MKHLVAAAAVVLFLPVLLLAYKSGPGPRMTGGFGEPTCAQCHQGQPPGDRALKIDAPRSYRGGGTYEVRVTLARPGLEVGGFTLSARYRSGPVEGKQAGELQAIDARVQVGTEGDVQYAQQTEEGARAATAGKLAWVLTWKAPSNWAGEVIFHAAANASNADESALGDRVYTAHAVTRPGR